MSSMAKLVRNSIFTVVALILTAVGLHWNKNISQSQDPIQIVATVLSSASNPDSQDFPLVLKFGQSRVKLGQYQEVSITTRPNVNLQIVTIYPNGTINNTQTRRAQTDETGRYSFRFKLDDFSLLGVFQVKVLSQAGNQESRASGSFVLQDWTNPKNPTNSYLYPFVP